MQRLLDFTARARTTDPATSHLAAAGVNVAASHALVMELFRQLDRRMTSFEIAASLKDYISESRVRGALKELERLGKVRRYSGAGVSNYGNKCDQWGAV